MSKDDPYFFGEVHRDYAVTQQSGVPTARGKTGLLFPWLNHKQALTAEPFGEHHRSRIVKAHSCNHLFFNILRNKLYFFAGPELLWHAFVLLGVEPHFSPLNYRL
ncbi:MAG: hypothetical protein EOO15_07585 [Chitinophagaceae bacterium]|nr:MAG: hypothetical protein EOO15_07585 [Chitinophagaceae bacterium]